MTFSNEHLERLRRETFIASTEHHRQTKSTNDLALASAMEANLALPRCVIADEQHAGRGRGGNVWWGQRGALMFSLVLDSAAMSIPNSAWPRASLTTGLAICRALQRLDDSIDFRLKWPNDVYANGKKVCGILIEVPPGQRERLVIGIGVNVANTFTSAPEELRVTATSLIDEQCHATNLPQVLIVIMQHLEDSLQSLATACANDDFTSLQSAWSDVCLLRGSPVTLTQGSRSTHGTCLGINDEGALMIDVNGRAERFFAGTITRFGT